MKYGKVFSDKTQDGSVLATNGTDYFVINKDVKKVLGAKSAEDFLNN